ncbi:hypothetical protein HanPSC8_Chr17g0787691 [Helianthus annuus]|nr:hypothetical protein HanPSC8_Chr17g0787691 [Helianthus annuus]
MVNTPFCGPSPLQPSFNHQPASLLPAHTTSSDPPSLKAHNTVDLTSRMPKCL